MAGVCPFPLVVAEPNNTNFIEDLAPALSCAFKCTGTMVTESDLEFYSTLQLVLSGVSLVLVSFVFLTWGCFSAKSKQKMTFWVSLCSLIPLASIFFPVVANDSAVDVWCKDELEGFTQETTGLTSCLVQSICIVFFALALCTWWFCSCFDIFCKLYLRKRRISHYIRYYHLFCWGIPTICTASLLIAQDLGYEQPRLWCFLSPGAPDAFEYLFFYGWVAVLWIGGTIMMLLVIWSIFSHSGLRSRNKNRGNNRGGRGYWKKLALYRTPIVFVIIFSFFWAVFFSFVIITAIDEDAYVEAATSWIRCLATGLGQLGDPSLPFNTDHVGVNELNPPQPEGTVGCGENQPGGVPKSLLTVAVVALAGHGTLVFIIFGLQKENFQLWQAWICGGCKLGRARDPKTDAYLPMSTFTSFRVGIANSVVNFCLRCSGQEHLIEQHQAVRKPSKNLKQGPDIGGANYNPKYVPKALPPSGSQPPPGAGMNPFVRQDSGGASLEQFYYNTGNSNLSNSRINDGGAPDPFPASQSRGGRMRSQMDYGSNWSDVFDDPLWGVNVEF